MAFRIITQSWGKSIEFVNDADDATPLKKGQVVSIWGDSHIANFYYWEEWYLVWIVEKDVAVGEEWSITIVDDSMNIEADLYAPVSDSPRKAWLILWVDVETGLVAEVAGTYAKGNFVLLKDVQPWCSKAIVRYTPTDSSY